MQAGAAPPECAAHDGHVRLEGLSHQRGADDRLCGADVDAIAAGATTVHSFLAFGKWNVGQDLRNEIPGPDALLDQVCVLAHPADAGLLGQRFFEHRAGVHIDFGLAVVESLMDFFLELFEPWSQNIVIIVVERVKRNIALIGVVQKGQVFFFGEIIGPQADHALNAGENLV